MTHVVLVLVAMYALVACGGAQASVSSTGQAEDTSGGAAGADNEFQLGQSNPTARGRGVQPSKIEATRTEAAIRFIVIDRDSGPIAGIVISLTAPGGKTYYTEETDAEGFAEVLVPVGKKYDLVYLSLGRRDISATVPVSDEPKQNIKLTLRYKRYDAPAPAKGKAGAAAVPRFVLEGVYFDSGKTSVREESFARLDRVVEYMTHKKSARIEISGHTDNVGDPKRNQVLSQQRAQACRDYLVSKGISPSRIEAVGRGDQQPVASNETEEGRQKNRRIEATEL